MLINEDEIFEDNYVPKTPYDKLYYREVKICQLRKRIDILKNLGVIDMIERTKIDQDEKELEKKHLLDVLNKISNEYFSYDSEYNFDESIKGEAVLTSVKKYKLL